MRIDRPAVNDGQPEAVQEVQVAIALRGQAEKVVYLLERDEEPGSGHEAENHRFGHIAGEIAELEEGDQDLDDADEDGENKHRLNPFAGDQREPGDGTENHQ